MRTSQHSPKPTPEREQATRLSARHGSAKRSLPDDPLPSGVESSPRQVAQRRQLDAILGPAMEPEAARGEGDLQLKTPPAVAQRETAEDKKEPLESGKAYKARRSNKDDLENQLKAWLDLEAQSWDRKILEAEEEELESRNQPSLKERFWNALKRKFLENKPLVESSPKGMKLLGTYLKKEKEVVGRLRDFEAIANTSEEHAFSLKEKLLGKEVRALFDSLEAVQLNLEKNLETSGEEILDPACAALEVIDMGIDKIKLSVSSR